MRKNFRVCIYLVFSNKDRRPLLRDKPARDALHSHLGGLEDHVHLLARFGRTITQAEWVKELKRVSNLGLEAAVTLGLFAPIRRTGERFGGRVEFYT